MSIKYLKGIYNTAGVRTTRQPASLRFPFGIKVEGTNLRTVSGATTETTETFDVLLVAGGGGGGPCTNSNDGQRAAGAGGSGGAGGVRLLTANNFSDVQQYANLCNINSATGINSIPITVGGGGGTSFFGSPVFGSNGGGGGGGGSWTGPFPRPASGGGSGGSGGNGGRGTPNGTPGTGIVGQGTPGGAAGQAGGSARAAGSCTGGLPTNFTGLSIRFGDGGRNGTEIAGEINRGNGGGSAIPGQGNGPEQPRPARGGRGGGSGLVAIRYRNPAAPTTPIATGGNQVCCTGGCIIHIFTSSGVLTTDAEFNIN